MSSTTNINIKFFRAKIIGDTPLICKRNPSVAEVTGSPHKRIWTPWDIYCDSLYWLTEKPENPTEAAMEYARFGYPSAAFKNSAIDAGYGQGVIQKKALTRVSFQILETLPEINGKPRFRDDQIRLMPQGSVEHRYRAEFPEWSTVLTFKYCADWISEDEIIRLMNLGGQVHGIGVWCPARDGEFGKYHIEA